MALLGEYALTPDVFDSTCYSNDELCRILLVDVKNALLEDGLVRDLRNGEWHDVFANGERSWHLKGKELLKKLVQQKRLVFCPSQGTQTPQHDADWCREALAVHGVNAIDGIIVTESLAPSFIGQPLVAAIQRLGSTSWWTSRSSSVTLTKTLVDYRAALRPVLSHANSFMFIDPHIRPSLPRYQDFGVLLQACGNRNPEPLIEIHRVCYEGSGEARQFLVMNDIEQEYRRVLAPKLAAVNLRVEVYIWDDFHDRYLVSDIVGISVPYGFDTSSAATTTRWTRLGRADRDSVQREFDPASGMHTLRHRFTIS